jgi:hypothetical protein
MQAVEMTATLVQTRTEVTQILQTSKSLLAFTTDGKFSLTESTMTSVNEILKTALQFEFSSWEIKKSLGRGLQDTETETDTDTDTDAAPTDSDTDADTDSTPAGNSTDTDATPQE